ncbi:MAG: T9SS type A sorting domain-containing protein [Saprospiraceae bacterium]|nr:T9SS type A sorting domain-containing protein [Saprospiraceae bacterium]
MEIIYTVYIKLFWQNIFNYQGRQFPIIFSFFLTTLFCANDGYAQCSGSTQFGTTQIPCSGFTGSVNSVPSQEYIKVNVINGINYTFTTTNVNITLVNDLNNFTVGNTTDTSITYTSTFSGLLRVYNCNPSVAASLSFVVNNTGSNVQDSQSSCGSNNWVGHLYKRLDDSLLIPPNNVNAFTSYVGYFNKTEVFSEGFGGNTNCFPTLSDSTHVINTYTEFFAAKLCNQSFKPEGAYVLSSITAGDGIRFYADGNLVFNRWINQTQTTYNNILFQHSGNTKLEINYFETGGENTLNVGVMTRVNNALTTNLSQTICEGTPPAQITGTNVLTTAPINSASGYAVTYQWQVSIDGTNYSNIVNATSQNYTPSQTTPETYYYKRLATITNINEGSIPVTTLDESNTAKIKIEPTPYIANISIECLDGSVRMIVHPVDSTLDATFTMTYNLPGGITLPETNTTGYFSVPNLHLLQSVQFETSLGNCSDSRTISFECPALLPVTIVNVYAQLKNESEAEIVWETANEVNVRHYIVEKSTSGTLFGPIGTVIASTDLSNFKTYRYEDNSLYSGINYYRIKIEDLDGTIYYTKIVSVYSENGQIVNFKIYPNPVTDNLYVEYANTKATSLDLSIYNHLGQLMSSSTYTDGAISNSIELSLFNLAAGMYIIKATDQHGNESVSKFFKTK